MKKLLKEKGRIAPKKALREGTSPQLKEFVRLVSEMPDSRMKAVALRSAPLVLKEAFGRFHSNFEVAEILSDFLIAYSSAVDSRKASKKTKFETTLTLFLRYQFIQRSNDLVSHHKSSKTAEASDIEDNDTTAYLYDRHSHKNYLDGGKDGGLTAEEMLCGFGIPLDIEESAVSDGDEGTNGSKQSRDVYLSRYLVCMDSFSEGLLSFKTQEILRLLSDRKVATGPMDLKTKLTAGRSKEDRANLAAELVTKISNAVHGTGYQVYIAECLNGARNKVFVAGRTPDEAAKFLAPYGELQELRPWTPNHAKNN